MSKKRTAAIVSVDQIERAIHIFRGQRVRLDSDLAKLYGVQSRRLNARVHLLEARRAAGVTCKAQLMQI